MASRFTEVEKWKDPWFRKLPVDQKLLFLYFCDNCDLAGFLEIDEELISFHTGIETRGLSGAIQGLSRGCVVADGWVWVKNFLKHQKNENLNPANNAHKNIICRLRDQLERFKNVKEFIEFRGSLAPDLGLISPPSKGNGKGKGISKGKRGETSEKPEQPEDPNPIKIPYREAAFLSEEEYLKLVAQYGKEKTEWMLDKLSNSKLANPKLKYISDYRAILSWVIEAADRNYKPTQQSPGRKMVM